MSPHANGTKYKHSLKSEWIDLIEGFSYFFVEFKFDRSKTGQNGQIGGDFGDAFPSHSPTGQSISRTDPFGLLAEGVFMHKSKRF